MKDPRARIRNKTETAFSQRKRRFYVVFRRDRKFQVSLALVVLFVVFILLSMFILPVSSFKSSNPFAFMSNGAETSVSYGAQVIMLPHSYFNMSYQLGPGLHSNFSVTQRSFSPFGLGAANVVHEGNISGSGTYSYYNSNSAEQVEIVGIIKPGTYNISSYDAYVNITATKTYSSTSNPYFLIAGILTLGASSAGIGGRIVSISKNPEAYFNKIDRDPLMNRSHKWYKKVNFREKLKDSKYPNPFFFIAGGVASLIIAGYLSFLSGIPLFFGYVLQVLGLVLFFAAAVFLGLILTGEPG